ncbi:MULTISPECIES: hypothetical protein [Natrialbaceae]|uniref:hypothetical protein n=1 Tax=Natrialbaceae TaxID=1644061 RepID=UPI00207CA63A|nr:hypothetical protein [Natronococcus sp. CG52]
MVWASSTCSHAASSGGQQPRRVSLATVRYPDVQYTAGAIAYVVWLYVIVEIVGLLLGIW